MHQKKVSRARRRQEVAAKTQEKEATLKKWEDTCRLTCAGTPRTPLCRLPRITITTTTTDLRIRPDGIITTGITTTTGTTTGVVGLTTVVEVEVTPAAAIIIIHATREEKMKPTTTTTTTTTITKER